MSVLTDGYNCENKHVHVRGEEIEADHARHHSGLAAWDSSAPFIPDFSGLYTSVSNDLQGHVERPRICK